MSSNPHNYIDYGDGDH